MSGRVVRLPSAFRDLDDASESIRRRDGPDRAIRFLRQAEATFARLAAMPGIGTPYEPTEPAYAGLRSFAVSRHRNHLVFYRPIDGGIEVFRVLHGARDISAVLAADFADQAGDNEED